MESTAPTASPSLKKLKREAAQRRKAQARSLKLRADEQERLQRLEIDALVEQQRLQRLERQRCEELAAARLVPGSPTPASSAIIPGSGGSVQQQHHHQVVSQLSHDGKCKPSAHGNNNNKPQHQDSCRGGGDRPNSCMSDGDHQQQQQQSGLQQHKSRAGGVKNSSSDGVGASGGGGGGGGGGGWRGKESQRSKHAQQQSMRAAVESRRRLARGPRSGVVGSDAHGGGPTLPSEDHRVVSTEYQAAGTQALMRVTLLAAGFVIGARGISARLIGQVTGAIVQSWTESCRPDAVPIRLFRIQGKKAVVQAAVALIGQAVGKYKDLCDCKRRGEFVQREHIINGVEFYYQPPPRKAFAINAQGDQQQLLQGPCCSGGGGSSSNKPGGGGGGPTLANDPVPGPGVAVVGQSGVGAAAGGAANVAIGSAPPQLSFTPHHVWLQHLHAQQQQKQAQQLQEQQQHAAQELQQAVKAGVVAGGGMVMDNLSMAGTGRPQPGFFDWRSQAQQQQVQGNKNSSQGPQILQGSLKGGGGSDQDLQQSKDGAVVVVDSRCTSTSELERIDQGLQQSVASLEQALHQVRLEQRLLQHNRAATEIGPPGCPGGDNASRGGIIVGNNNLMQQQQQQQLQVGSERVQSLWAEVGIGGGQCERTQGFQLGSSLFSIFGSGELPLPISSPHDGRSSSAGPGVVDGTGAVVPANALGLQQQLNSSMASSTTVGPFDFPRCDFLRESLDAFPFAPRDKSSNSNCNVNGSVSEYSLYGHSKNNVVVGDSGSDSSLCIVCLEQPAGVRLMACGHTSFCLACVQGLVNCPLCREKIVGLHQCPSFRPGSSPAAAAGTTAGQQRGGPAVAPKLNGSSYHLWNWVPGASV